MAKSSHSFFILLSNFPEERGKLLYSTSLTQVYMYDMVNNVNKK